MPTPNPPHRCLQYNCKKFNCQKLEATNMSFSGWMDEYIVVLADNGRLFSAKKK